MSINGIKGEELDTALGTVLQIQPRRRRLHRRRLGAPGRRRGRGEGPLSARRWPRGPRSSPIEVRGLCKTYGELTAVDNVDLTVEPGDVFGYLGPNGAGKTTSLRMMLGLIRPTAGTVRLFGRDPQATVRALEGVAGFVEAPSFYPYLNGRANLELLAALRRRRRQGADRGVAGDRRPDRPGQGPRRRLLARDAPAPRDRRRAAAPAEAAAARRARHRPRPGRDARHARPDPRPLRPGDDGAPLQPPAGRGRRTLQPRRDRAQGRRRLPGIARRPAPRRRRRLPAADDRGRDRQAGRRGAGRDRRSRDRGGGRHHLQRRG